ncbi:MAG: hypothetical protein IH956_02025 [Chloroflexi bacterium]|nr:hypothetical protein [Chloroflexota bacterium]
MRQQIDEKRYRASIARLEAVFRGISETATQVSTRRCPYKNVQDRCTAKFGCRNQHRTPTGRGELPICTGSDNLDYRSAWEV